MASPKSIPSQLSGPAGEFVIEQEDPTSINKQEHFYITALLQSSALSIDGISIGSPGPVTLSSPIKCRTFTTGADAQVAYFIQ